MTRNSHVFVYLGDWSNGMIGVSKTFGGSSILSSPVQISKTTRTYAPVVSFSVCLYLKINVPPAHDCRVLKNAKGEIKRLALNEGLT